MDGVCERVYFVLLEGGWGNRLARLDGTLVVALRSCWFVLCCFPVLCGWTFVCVCQCLYSRMVGGATVWRVSGGLLFCCVRVELSCVFFFFGMSRCFLLLLLFSGFSLGSISHCIIILYSIVTMVPDHAIVQEHPEERTYAQLREQMALHATPLTTNTPRGSISSSAAQLVLDDDQKDDFVSLGCGSRAVEWETEPSEFLVLEEEDDSSTTMDTRTHHAHGRRRLMQVLNGQACNNETNFFCWMSCLDIPHYRQRKSYLKQGYSLYCMDPHIYVQSGHDVAAAVEPCQDGLVNNPECMGKWAKTSATVPAYDLQQQQSPSLHIQDSSTKSDGGEPDDADNAWIFENEEADDNKFCFGGTSMYMAGFAWMRSTCVIFLFPQWILTNRFKFSVACLATFALGAGLEWILQARRHTVRAMAAAAAAAATTTRTPFGTRPPPYRPGLRVAIVASLYAIQLIMGYLLMLVIMTYNGLL